MKYLFIHFFPYFIIPRDDIGDRRENIAIKKKEKKQIIGESSNLFTSVQNLFGTWPKSKEISKPIQSILSIFSFLSFSHIHMPAFLSIAKPATSQPLLLVLLRGIINSSSSIITETVIVVVVRSCDPGLPNPLAYSLL